MIIHEKMTAEQAIFILANVRVADEFQGNQAVTAAFIKAMLALEEQAKREKKKKRPKCENNHRCDTCIYCDDKWNELVFKGFVCSINAK